MRTVMIAAIAASIGFAAIASADAAGMMMKPMMSAAASCKGMFMYWDKKTHKCVDATQ